MPPSTFSTTKQTILVLEDDYANGEFLRAAITAETSYQVLLMKNAEEALQYLQEIIAASPILFILDFYLSRMTGLELYDHFHRTKELEQVPAIILTAAQLDQQVEQEITQRHIEVLAKPLELDELLRYIEQTIERGTNH